MTYVYNLTVADERNLAVSWLRREDLIAARVCRVDSFEGANIVGRKPNANTDYAGLVFENWPPGARWPRKSRLRLDNPPMEYNKNGQLEPKQKYLQAPGCRATLYFPRNTDVALLADPHLPIIITEGEKKTLALHRLSLHQRIEGRRFLAIGLEGVWNWRGVTGKDVNERGARVSVKGVIPDFDLVVWSEREVTLCFDANTETNSSVAAAQRELARELLRRGARVFVANVPASAGVSGVDDWLGKAGPVVVGQHLDKPTPFDWAAAMPHYALTDLGNAERLKYWFGNEYRHDGVSQRWLRWDGTRWGYDDKAAREYAKETVRRIEREQEHAPLDRREALGRWAKSSQSAGAIMAALSLASSDADISVTPDDLDADHFTFNAANYTLELNQTQEGWGWEVRHPDPADLLTKQSRAAYDHQAKCPTWTGFLQKIFAGSQSLIDWLQKAVGYSLTANVTEQCLFFLYGTGRNGKSTFCNTLLALVGEYGHKAALSLLLPSKGGNEDAYALADLKGVRVVVASEMEENKGLSEGRVKELTGGDWLTGRHPFGRAFRFLPTHKLWLYGNHRPPIRGVDDGIWRRLRLIPFEVQISEDEIDSDLGDKLLKELPGILVWAMTGAVRWREEGLGWHEAVRAATQGYREEQDVLGRFLVEMCAMGAGLQSRSSQLYDAYKAWAASNGEHELSQTMFSKRLTERGCTKQRSATGQFWRGIGLLDGGSSVGSV